MQKISGEEYLSNENEDEKLKRMEEEHLLFLWSQRPHNYVKEDDPKEVIIFNIYGERTKMQLLMVRINNSKL